MMFEDSLFDTKSPADAKEKFFALATRDSIPFSQGNVFTFPSPQKQQQQQQRRRRQQLDCRCCVLLVPAKQEEGNSIFFPL